MEKTVRAKLRRLLQDRRDTLVDHWYTTLALSSFLALNADEMRHHLGAAVDRIIALLLAEPFDRDVGQDIGVALAALPYLQPEALGLTHDALELHLVRNLTAADQAAIQPRLVALLGALATGFCRQMRASTLAEQEQIRVALLIEQRRMEGALRESEARFRTTFEEASIGIALIDMEKRILESNPALQRMLGYGRDEMRGVVFTTIAHADDMAANAVLYDELVAGKRDRYSIEGRYICKDGHILCAHVAVSLVHGAGHVPPFTIKMVEDITARKQVESELREARRRQMDSREAERVHLAREVHDGPVQDLYGVRFRLTALAKSVRNPTSRVELTTAQAMVHEATETLRTMCRDLRPPTLRTFGVEGAIHSHVEQVRAAHPEMAIHVQAIPDGQLLAEWVRVAMFRVYQATVNNAVQHAGARVIVIRFEVDMERVLLEVRDDGCGFMIPDRWSELGAARQ